MHIFFYLFNIVPFLVPESCLNMQDCAGGSMEKSEKHIYMYRGEIGLINGSALIWAIFMSIWGRYEFTKMRKTKTSAKRLDIHYDR